MKKILSAFLLIAMFFTIPSVCYAVEDVALSNGDFSQETKDWTTLNAELTVERSGGNNAYGKVVMTEAYGRAMHKFQFERNVRYVISVDVRIDEGRNSANLIIDHRSFGDKSLILSVAKDVTVSNEWAKLTGQYVFQGEGTGEAQIYVRVGGAVKPLTYYMDNLSIEKYAEDTSAFQPTEAKSGELIQNFGFDNGTEGYIAKGASISTSKNGAKNTENCIRVQGDDGTTFVGQNVVLEKDALYEISAYVKTENGHVDVDFLTYAVKDQSMDDGGAVRNYSQLDSTEAIPVSLGKGSADNRWTLIKTTYVHRKEDGNVLLGISPVLEAGVSCLIDELSIIKQKDVEPLDYHAGIGNGLMIDGVFYASPSWVIMKNGYAVANARELAAVLEADYDNNIIQKGFRKLVLDTEKNFAYLNDTLVPVKEIYAQNEDVFVDLEAVCRSFGAEVSISNGLITIKTAEEGKALTNLAKSLAKEKTATVAFFGAGAAYGRGAGVTNLTSYRAEVMKWLRNKYPDCTIEEQNNTFWYADSTMANYSVDELIKSEPEVVFLDFAPEDMDLSYEKVKANLESILAKIQKESPKTDVIFVLGYCQEIYDARNEGATHWLQNAYDDTAKKYSLPVIDMNVIVADAAEAAKGKPEDYMRYLWLPNDSGHRLYADAICGFTNQQLENPANKKNEKQVEQKGIMDGTVVLASDAKVKGFSKKDQVLAGKIGDVLEFEFEGNAVGVFWKSGLDTGAVAVEIDGVEKGVFYAFDRFGVRKEKTHYAIFDDQLQDGKHTLKLTVLKEKDKMSLGNRIEIEAFLVGTEMNG